MGFREVKGTRGKSIGVQYLEHSHHPYSFSFSPQWLHRSAWSYGGLDSGPNDEDPDHLGPSSSQLLANLVIGTYETNTAMLRYIYLVLKSLFSTERRYIIGTKRSPKD